ENERMFFYLIISLRQRKGYRKVHLFLKEKEDKTFRVMIKKI
ncbi:hypothetical protein SAMN04488098_10981, partial [Alkalibacterium thalassium]